MSMPYLITGQILTLFWLTAFDRIIREVNADPKYKGYGPAYTTVVAASMPFLWPMFILFFIGVYLSLKNK